MIHPIYIAVAQELADGKKLKTIVKKRNLNYKKTHNELTAVKGILKAKTTNHLIAILLRRGIIQ
jgi:DNA-binding CsgD family transcriptional regulator